MSIPLHRIGKATAAVALLLAALLPSTARCQDTVRTLDEVEVHSQLPPSTLRTAAPTQVVDIKRIEDQGSLLLSDAVKLMAGVTLKDYGGVGGMKTVSARGLGSQFSTVTIDGIAVSDAQNGHVDLGRYMLGNAAFVSFSQGQQQDLLLSARSYAAGNVLNLESSEPDFFLAERTNLKVAMEAGSFGLLNPSVLWEQKWNRRLKSSMWVSWLKSDGNYPFTLYYTAGRTDSSSREVRHHSANTMLTADANLFYTIGKDNTLTTKVHYMRGTHQLPGPVQFYRQTPSAQNTQEEVAFLQSRWRVLRDRWKWQLLAKFHATYDFFEDSAAQTLTRYQHNDYRQREAYLDASTAWSPTAWLDISTAADASLAHLRSNLAQNNDVHRSNLAAVAALRLHAHNTELKAHLLATHIADHLTDLSPTPAYQRLSPYIGAMTSIADGHVSFRYFYKETFRAPNFSELYFFTLPHDLRPECARQHNIGFTYADALQLHNSDLQLSTTLDAYYNRVSDKILAIPTQNMFLWSMQNLGRAEITGIDATANAQLTFGHSLLSFQLNYSFQHATDRTDPDSRTYGHQIAYTPLHNGGATARWENPWLNLGASALVVGERYYRMQNTPETLMPAYTDLSLSADRKVNLRWGSLRIQVQVLNLLNVQYEVVRSYPMMGRNYRLKLIYEI